MFDRNNIPTGPFVQVNLNSIPKEAFRMSSSSWNSWQCTEPRAESTVELIQKLKQRSARTNHWNSWIYPKDSGRLLGILDESNRIEIQRLWSRWWDTSKRGLLRWVCTGQFECLRLCNRWTASVVWTPCRMTDLAFWRTLCLCPRNRGGAGHSRLHLHICPTASWFDWQGSRWSGGSGWTWGSE